MVRCSFRHFRHHRCCWRTPWTSRNRCQHRSHWRRDPHGRCSILLKGQIRSRCNLSWKCLNPSKTGFQNTQWNYSNRWSSSRASCSHWEFHNKRTMMSWKTDFPSTCKERKHTHRSNLHCFHMVRCSFRHFRRHRCCWRTPWTNRSHCQRGSHRRTVLHWRCSILLKGRIRSRCNLSWKCLNQSMTGFLSARWNCSSQQSNSRASWWHWGFHNTRTRRWWRIDSRWQCTEHRHTRRSNFHCFHMVRCSFRRCRLRRCCCWSTPWTNHSHCQRASHRHTGPHGRCSILLIARIRSRCNLSWKCLNPSTTGFLSTRSNCWSQRLNNRALW